MAFQLKYYFDFYRLNTTEKHTVEIWQDTEDVLVAEEITGMASPLIVEMPELGNKFQVVRGKGCSLTLVSKTDGQFFDSLYHVDPCEIKLIHKISDVVESVFYLDSEMMQEPFSEAKNYPVNVTGNDGLGLMDRFSFVEVGGAHYEGIKSKLEILQIILNKVGLWTHIGFDLATTFSGSTNLLSDSYINCENFYDEDGKPMSLREVADSILAPYGAHIETKGEAVLISDVHTKATKTTLNYSMFALSDLSSASALNIANIKEITAASFRGTGSDKERSGGVNRQVVSYSPFPQKLVVSETLSEVAEFETVPDAFSTKDGYFYKTLSDNKFWVIDFSQSVILNPATFEASYYENEQDSNVYLRYPVKIGLNGPIAQCKATPYITVKGVNPLAIYDTNNRIIRIKYSSGASFLISGEVLVKTKDNPYTDVESNVKISSVLISCRIRVGNKYYDPTTLSFVTTQTTFIIKVESSSNMSMSDKFTPFNYKVTVGNMGDDVILNGNFQFEVWSEISHRWSGDYMINSLFLDEVWLKNISINMVNFDGSKMTDTDITYIGILDKNFQNEGDEIKLTCGTDTNFADRGKIMKFDDPNYVAINQWTRAVQTYKIEELLLNSLCSNYKAGFITLSNLKLKADFPIHSIFTYATVPGVKLMVKSAKIDYHDNVAEVTLVEIQEDELTIVKE